MGHGGESGGGYVVGGGSDTAMAEAADRANTERTDVRERRREKDRDCEGGRGTVKVLTFDKPPPPRAAPRSRPRPPPQPATPASLSPFVVLASSCSRFAYSPFTPPRLSQTIIRTIRNRRRLASRGWSVGLASSARGVKGHRENCRHRPDTSVPSSRDIVLGSTFLLLFFPSKYTITWIRSCNLILSFRFFSFFLFFFFFINTFNVEFSSLATLRANEQYSRYVSVSQRFTYVFEQEIFVNLGSRLADRLVRCTLPKRAYPLGLVSYAINTLNDVRVT